MSKKNNVLLDWWLDFFPYLMIFIIMCLVYVFVLLGVGHRNYFFEYLILGWLGLVFVFTWFKNYCGGKE